MGKVKSRTRQKTTREQSSRIEMEASCQVCQVITSQLIVGLRWFYSFVWYGIADSKTGPTEEGKSRCNIESIVPQKTEWKMVANINRPTAEK